MRIIFLTNNPISYPLSEWLIKQNETVILYEDKIKAQKIIDDGIDFAISYNYRYIIPADVISLLPHKILNLHNSFLPYNRGSSPNIFSILDKTPCGVTIHEISPELDKGNILLQKQLTFDYHTETLKSSYEKLNEEIQTLFKENWEEIKNGTIIPKEQIGKGTYHRSSDLDIYRSILDYNDTIDVFLKKARQINPQIQH